MRRSALPSNRPASNVAHSPSPLPSQIRTTVTPGARALALVADAAGGCARRGMAHGPNAQAYSPWPSYPSGVAVFP